MKSEKDEFNDSRVYIYVLFLQTILAGSHPIHPHASDDPSLDAELTQVG